jgi:hypothetical protein
MFFIEIHLAKVFASLHNYYRLLFGIFLDVGRNKYNRMIFE